MATDGDSILDSKNNVSVKRMQNECRNGEVMKLPDEAREQQQPSSWTARVPQ